MLNAIEDCRNEFKIKLSDDLEETVISFLNSKDGGNIYIGVADNGKIIGLKNNLDLLHLDKGVGQRLIKKDNSIQNNQ